jgi:hypothetical protein
MWVSGIPPVLSGQLMGQPMNLIFSPLEILAIILAVVVARPPHHDSRRIALLAQYKKLGVTQPSGFHVPEIILYVRN